MRTIVSLVFALRVVSEDGSCPSKQMAVAAPILLQQQVLSSKLDTARKPEGDELEKAAEATPKKGRKAENAKKVTCMCTNANQRMPKNGFECSDKEKGGYCRPSQACVQTGSWVHPDTINNKTAWGDVCSFKSDKICANQAKELTTGMMIESDKAKLVMQGDGNLVLMKKSDDSVLWATATEENPGAKLVIQDDCNTVIYSSEGKPLWSSRGGVMGAAKSHFESVKNFFLNFDLKNAISGAKGLYNKISKDQTCADGKDRDAKVCLTLQNDCNLVVYGDGNKAIFDTKTSC